MIHEEPDKAKGLIGYLLPEHEKVPSGQSDDTADACSLAPLVLKSEKTL